LVAHELAIELQRRACTVRRLILLDAPIAADDIANIRNAAAENEALENTLQANGIDLDRQSQHLNHQPTEALIRQRGMVEGELPSSQLLEIVVQNINTNELLLSQHAPDVFDGNMIIFSARRKSAGSPLLNSWRPYVNGDITEYPVDCTHHEMLNTNSIKLFGEQLKAAIA